MTAARAVVGAEVEHRDGEGNLTRTLNLQRPWRRARYRDLICEVAGDDWFSLKAEARRDRALERMESRQIFGKIILKMD